MSSIITSNLNEKQDIVRFKENFNSRVGMFCKKFHSFDQRLKLKFMGAVMHIHEFSFPYNYALKKFLNFPKSLCNQTVCTNLGILLVKHFF